MRSWRARCYTAAWKARAAYIGGDPSKLSTKDHYPNYPTVADADVKSYCKTANSQLTLYRTRKSETEASSRERVMESAEDMPAYLWWGANGADYTELQYAARLILSQPASASICERINSEFAFVKDPRRNKLGHERSNKLVALFHNLRLIHRMKKTGYTEPAIGWNDEDNHSGVKKYGVAKYTGTAKLKVTTPVRPALLPAPEAVPEPADGWALLM